MNVEDILIQLSDLGLLRLHRPVGDYYQIYCPIHKDGKERKPSCGVLLNNQYRNGKQYPQGFTHCFSCGYAKSMPNLIKDICNTRNIPISTLPENILQILDENHEQSDEYLVPKTIMQNIYNSYAIDYMKNLMSSQKDQYIDESELEKYRFTVQYMYDRKLTDEVIEKFDIGFDPNFIPEGKVKPIPCITFPVRDISGNTLFICRRSISGKSFYLPKHINKPLYGIYELPKECNSVLICESCFNALTAVSYGFPAVAMLGTGTEFQIKQLRQLGVKEFVIGTDPDDAGNKCATKLKRALKDVAIVRRMNDIPAGKDINDLSYEEFVDIYNKRL